MRLVRNECTQLSACVRCHSISLCRGGGGEELCQMLFGNREGWRLSVFYIIDIVCKIVYA